MRSRTVAYQTNTHDDMYRPAHALAELVMTDIRRHATDIQKMIMRDHPGVALRDIGVLINYWPMRNALL